MKLRLDILCIIAGLISICFGSMAGMLFINWVVNSPLFK